MQANSIFTPLLMHLATDLQFPRLHLVKFVSSHLVLPGVVLGLLFVVLEGRGWDLVLSAHFYNVELHQWPYKDHWLIQRVLHKGGRWVYFSLLAVILIQFGRTWVQKSGLKPCRRALAYAFLASIAGPLMIMWLKNHTHIYCPWDLLLFDSHRPYIRFFDPVTGDLPIGHCFPAAHAGSGYAFVSLYFYFWLTHPKYRYYALGFGLGLGGLYGFTQQMRGAHFLSHDVMSLIICWYASVTLFLLFFSRVISWHLPKGPAGPK